MESYTSGALEKMGKEVESIGDMLVAIDKFLAKEAAPANKGNKDNKEDIKNKNNVIYVDFALPNEFKSAISKRMKLTLIIGMYHDWAERTLFLVEENSGRFGKKGKLLSHVTQLRNMVSTISKLDPNS